MVGVVVVIGRMETRLKNDFQQNEVFISQKNLNDSDSARLISSTDKKELITVIKKIEKSPGTWVR